MVQAARGCDHHSARSHVDGAARGDAEVLRRVRAETAAGSDVGHRQGAHAEQAADLLERSRRRRLGGIGGDWRAYPVMGAFINDNEFNPVPC